MDDMAIQVLRQIKPKSDCKYLDFGAKPALPDVRQTFLPAFLVSSRGPEAVTLYPLYVYVPQLPRER